MLKVYGTIKYASGRVTTAQLRAKTCTIKTGSVNVGLTFTGRGESEWGYPVEGVQLQLPKDLAQRVAKVILSQVEGLWDNWSLEFPDETAA